MIVITWAILGVTALIVILMAWYLRRTKIKQSGGQARNKQSQVEDAKKQKTAENLTEMFEVVNIKEGLMEMTYSRYRMIMRLSSADFFLLSVEEQTAVEECLIAVMMGLSFPVQILTTSEAVETKSIINELRENIINLNPELQNYAMNFATYMEGIKTQKSAAMRSAYVVIPFDTDKGFEHAKAELIGRASILADGLNAAKMSCEALNTSAIVDLLHHLLNRGKLFKPSEADEYGIMNSYHVPAKGVGDVA